MAGIVDQFQVSSGSIIGREHARLHRNNQDGVALSLSNDLLVAAVADGCSSGRFSEVGARLGVRWLVSQLAGPLAERLQDSTQTLLEAVTEGLVGYLAGVAMGLEVDGADWPGLVRDYLLFTFQVAIVGPSRTLVFGLGDGVVSINGRVTALDAGPSNAPAYLGYRLVGSEAGAPPSSSLAAANLEPVNLKGLDLRPVVHFDGPTESIYSLLIGTDGLLDLQRNSQLPLKDGSMVGGIEAFEREDGYLRNSSLLQKRLVVLGEVNQRLRDDTSLVLIRRRGHEN